MAISLFNVLDQNKKARCSSRHPTDPATVGPDAKEAAAAAKAKEGKKNKKARLEEKFALRNYLEYETGVDSLVTTNVLDFSA